jgi:hypothetical protein
MSMLHHFNKMQAVASCIYVDQPAKARSHSNLRIIAVGILAVWLHDMGPMRLPSCQMLLASTSVCQ